MGRRKKDELPPIKLVLGRSPDKKKGQQNANYTVLNKSESDEAMMRAKRKASNIDPKKWQEESDDDDLEVLEVYKPPPSTRHATPSSNRMQSTPGSNRVPTPGSNRVPTPGSNRSSTPSSNRVSTPSSNRVSTPSSNRVSTPSSNREPTTPASGRTRGRPSNAARRAATHQHQLYMSHHSLVMECVEEELSPAQKQAARSQVAEFDKAKQKIDKVKKSSTSTEYTEEVVQAYIGPEATTVKHVAGPPPDTNHARRSVSPDVMIVDGPTITRKPTRAMRQTVPTQPPPLQNKPAPLPGPPTRAQDVVLMGPNGQPIVIPAHLMPQGNQPIVLQSNQTGQFQIVGSTNQTTPVIGQAMIAPKTRLTPPLAPRMPALMGSANLPPPPPLQNMTRGRAHAQIPPLQGTRGIKRPSESPVVPPPPKRTRNRRKQQQPLPLAPATPTDEKDSVNWVPLDEYYYSKKEGDPAYREEKGEYRFKCFYCFKMLYNNLRIMMHIQGHIDSEKQQNLDLSDLTQCKHCYKQFDTPFEMQCHVEKIHQNRSNVLVCRICEKDHTSQGDLKGHMRMHNACEMPYICQLCNFRSSVYNDVVDHFKKRHDSSRYMVCLYCLKVFEIKKKKVPTATLR